MTDRRELWKEGANERKKEKEIEEKEGMEEETTTVKETGKGKKEGLND